MSFTSLFLLAAETAAADTEPKSGGLASMLLPLALMVVVFYFLLVRPEKKRSKQMKLLLENIQIADEVVTSGGIIGRVLSVKDDTVLIETGGDKTRLRVLRSAIAENRTSHDN